ncbi:hypothetical protein M0657_008690 [Pyricularia oryzae]|nr:hypothetical protein M0657_008690 [Pyricularia oryzae]
MEAMLRTQLPIGIRNKENGGLAPIRRLVQIGTMTRERERYKKKKKSSFALQ